MRGPDVAVHRLCPGPAKGVVFDEPAAQARRPLQRLFLMRLTVSQREGFRCQVGSSSQRMSLVLPSSRTVCRSCRRRRLATGSGSPRCPKNAWWVAVMAGTRASNARWWLIPSTPSRCSSIHPFELGRGGQVFVGQGQRGRADDLLVADPYRRRQADRPVAVAAYVRLRQGWDMACSVGRPASLTSRPNREHRVKQSRLDLMRPSAWPGWKLDRDGRPVVFDEPSEFHTFEAHTPTLPHRACQQLLPRRHVRAFPRDSPGRRGRVQHRG